MHAIVTKELTKKFGELIAVNKVSLKIKKGELFGLLGPNGAGKTTFISMLCTMLKPTEGEAWVEGYNIKKQRDEVRKSIGIVFQDPSLDQNLTAKENLDFHARLYGLDKKTREERINEVLELVELSDKKAQLVKTFSGGMRRRLEIARGLMHLPKILFLDEPTLGLDPQTRRRIWEYIMKLKKEEKITIILTTHYMEEADFLCDRVAIIDNGKIIALDTPENLKNIVGGDVIYLRASSQEKLLELLEGLNLKARIIDETLNISISDGETFIPKILDIARKSGIEVYSIGLRKPTLEDVFIHFTGREIREERGSALTYARAVVRARRMK